MFFSPSFSCSASLCEQLLAGGSGETPAYSLLGILTYYFFLLLTPPRLRIPQGLEDCRITASFYSYRDYRSGENDWKTAVLLLPFTTGITTEGINRIGILPYYYFLLLSVPSNRIGRLPYLSFLLLRRFATLGTSDWKTAVFILPFTLQNGSRFLKGLEDCRITTSFYFESKHLTAKLDWKTAVFILPSTPSCVRVVLDWKTAVFILPFTCVESGAA